MTLLGYPLYAAPYSEKYPAPPAHWRLTALKRLVKSRSGSSIIKGQCASEEEAHLYPGFSASGQDVWLESFDYEMPGVVVSAVGARCGKTFKADGKWGAVANTHCLFPDQGLDRDYLWYLTNTDSWWDVGGTAQPFVLVQESLSRRWPVPPIEEQLSIVRFLNRETAKIDALIAQQERLIVLMKEKRQAVISNAVTKGLDPNVPMKDSGVPWIGVVPAHWKTQRLKDVVLDFVSGGTPDTERDAYWTGEDQGIPWVTIGDMSGGDVVVRTEKYITEAARQDRRLQFVEPGMLLLSMYASLGKATPVGTKAVINQALLGIAPDTESMNGRFLLWWLRHIEPLHAQTASSNTQANLNAQKVRNIPVPLPPLDEQRTIADFIEESDERFRAAAGASAQAVQLLRERRTALITAAVTGQIDVRRLVEVAA